jgi:hypothetical protein
MKQPTQLGRALGSMLGFWLYGTGSAHAVGDSFHCPTNMRLVQKGDSTKIVVEKCGNPKSREDMISHECDDDTGYCYDLKVGERWTYDFGKTQLTKVLFFRGDRLSVIEAGFYGEKP